MLGLILFVIAFVIAMIIVNKVQQLYMKMMGAEMMFFSGKKKLIAIFIVGAIIFGAAAKIFGLA